MSPQPRIAPGIHEVLTKHLLDERTLAPILTSVCLSNSTQEVFGANAAQILEGHCQESESSLVLF